MRWERGKSDAQPLQTVWEVTGSTWCRTLSSAPWLGRPAELPDIESMVGLFLQTPGESGRSVTGFFRNGTPSPANGDRGEPHHHFFSEMQCSR